MLRRILHRFRESDAPSQRRVRPLGVARIAVALDRDWPTRIGFTTRAFARLLRRSGASMTPVVFSPGEADELAEFATRLMAQVDALLLSGGVDVDPLLYGAEREGARLEPRRDRFEIALVAEASRRGMPVFGVCRGCQLINVYHGGTLRSLRNDPALAKLHGPFRAHPVRVLPDTRLATIVGRDTLRWVRSIHGQAVGRVGHGLRVAALATDDVPEAIESDDLTGQRQWILGVQWHPELSWQRRDDHSLIGEFVSQAARYRARVEQAPVA
jgi:putative glutamine amidotransferase